MVWLVGWLLGLVGLVGAFGLVRLARLAGWLVGLVGLPGWLVGLVGLFLRSWTSRRTLMSYKGGPGCFYPLC